LPKKKDPAAVKLGRKGGKEIAKRGPEILQAVASSTGEAQGRSASQSKKSH